MSKFTHIGGTGFDENRCFRRCFWWGSWFRRFRGYWVGTVQSGSRLPRRIAGSTDVSRDTRWTSNRSVQELTPRFYPKVALLPIAAGLELKATLVAAGIFAADVTCLGRWNSRICDCTCSCTRGVFAVFPRRSPRSEKMSREVVARHAASFRQRPSPCAYSYSTRMILTTFGLAGGLVEADSVRASP